MKRYLSALLALTLASLTLVSTATPVSAEVPGKPFTATGCTEYTDSVARLYTAGLGRAPEVGGFEFWVTEYMAGRYSLASMAVFFTQSPEFAESYGDPSNLDFVEIMYRNVLGRDGEPGGVEFWTGELDAGNRRRATVLLNFAESPENITNSGTTTPILGDFNAGQVAGVWSCENPTPGPAPSTVTPTAEQQGAIDLVESMLPSSLSRSELIEQLVFEDFTISDAAFAVDALEIDFNAAAQGKAASHLELLPFSRSGLINQLVFDGFTTTQAIHGTDAQGANYFGQAGFKAATYLDVTVWSCDGLIDQLQFEGFTSVEATLGVDSIDACGAALVPQTQRHALRTAEVYLRLAPFSRSALIVQMGSEGITATDAAQAVDSLEIDFNVEAAAKASSYSVFSCEGLIERLEIDGYTLAEATAGAASNSACDADAPAQQPTPAQLNAIADARAYLLIAPFSRIGLMAELEFDGVSIPDARFAVDSFEIDFATQAAAQASRHLELLPYSRSGLIIALEASGFRTAEAVAGVDGLAVDYDKQAEFAAASYLKGASFTCDGLIEQLELDDFLTEQATQGADSTGICG